MRPPTTSRGSLRSRNVRPEQAVVEVIAAADRQFRQLVGGLAAGVDGARAGDAQYQDGLHFHAPQFAQLAASGIVLLGQGGPPLGPGPGVRAPPGR